MKKEIRFFEELAAKGHQALNTMLYDGWILRSAKGLTGRANSVLPLYPSTKALEEKVLFCEQWYKKQGLPADFKLTEESQELSDFLSARGYQLVTPTDVMLKKNLASSQASYTDCTFSSSPEEWLTYYFDFEKLTDKAKQKTFREMLSKVLVDTIYASVIHQGKVAACASAAIEEGYALIQNVIVSEAYRGQGLGEKLCRSLIAKTREIGAKSAYLQVVQTNEAAKKLYEKLGFERLYSYWYMKKTDLSKGASIFFKACTSSAEKG
ncbi:MAG: GNAT family N-acetyltransferase [Treponemataceae bacterium]|nr:GNAT family N-acetyltransferase [Treponemataceae bacterium]